MARLNGWQQLWVVGIILLAVLLMITGELLVPTKQSIDQKYTGVLDTQRRYLTDIKANGNQTDPASQDFLGGSALADTQARINALEAQRQHDLDVLWFSQVKTRSIISSIWIAFSAALYAVGWLLGWIYRGFKLKGKPHA